MEKRQLRYSVSYSVLIVYFNGRNHFLCISGLIKDILVVKILSHLNLTRIFRKILDRRDSEISTQSVLIAFYRPSRFFTDPVGIPRPSRESRIIRTYNQYFWTSQLSSSIYPEFRVQSRPNKQSNEQGI
jgi:hypothetical protein